MQINWLIASLNRGHDRSQFDCGEPDLNEYLIRYARQNQDAGIARTFVAANKTCPERVLAYYSLSVGSIDKTNLPINIAKRLPRFPIPIVRLARLAVDRSAQGLGLGEDMLLDALQRCLRVESEVGILAVLVDAKHERARAFYERYEFETLPDQPLTLWLPVSAIRKLFAE